jgi:glycosyltransferase involved in cell wall biosynthesis
VPVYNAEKYLERCLDSITGQTLREIEIVCVNDGSTDGSSAILDEYAQKDPRLIVFHQENKGPGAARNTALDNAKGKYILFCDADDALESDACRECCTAMENNGVDMVIFNTKIIEVDRNAFNNNNTSGEIILLIQPENVGFLNKKKCVKTATFCNVWNYFFSCDLINRYCLRFTNYMAGEDTIFVQCYLMLIQNGYALEDRLYNYYAHKDSLSDAAYSKHIWMKRFIFLPKLLWNTFKFAAKNKILFRWFYVLYWFFAWLRSRVK